MPTSATLGQVAQESRGNRRTSPVHPQFNPTWIDEFLFWLRKAKCHGDEEDIYQSTGIPVSTIGDQIATSPRLRPGLEYTFEQLARVQTRRPLEALRLHQLLADRLKHRVCLVAVAGAGDHRTLLLRLVAELADLARMTSDAGPELSAEERASLDREAAELGEAVTAYRRSLAVQEAR